MPMLHKNSIDNRASIEDANAVLTISLKSHISAIRIKTA